MLPIYFIWLGSVVPALYLQKLQQCKQNYGDCRLVGETEQRQLLKKYDMVHPNNTVIQRADVLRLLVIQEYGGIYMDFDVQVYNWDYLKQLNCQEVFFSEEQITLISEHDFRVGNWLACGGKNNKELARLIKGIKPMHANPSVDQILQYAGPGYLDVMKAPYMLTYPNVKHCYHNNWTDRRPGCKTPLYSWWRYLGAQCTAIIISEAVLAIVAVYLVYYKFKGDKEGKAGKNDHEQRQRLAMSEELAQRNE